MRITVTVELTSRTADYLARLAIALIIVCG